MTGRTRRAGRASAVALAAILLVVSAATLLTLSPRATAADLVPGTDFTISSAISSSPTQPEPPALLHPGATRYLWYRVHNPLTAPITVTSLGIARVDTPASCTANNLDLGGTSFYGSLSVPAGSAVWVPRPMPIALLDLPYDQDGCKDVTFTFTYRGAAHYTDRTSTVLTASPLTTDLGMPVTLTATVTADNAASHGGTPGGTVEFLTCATPGCDPTTPLGTATIGTGGRAILSTAALPPGTHRLKAVYVTPSTDLAGSTSEVISHVVTSAIGTRTTLTSGPNPSARGNPVTLSAAVSAQGGVTPGGGTTQAGTATPSGTVSFFQVPATGEPRLLGTAPLDAQGRARLVVTSLPAGFQPLFAVYGGTATLTGSTSPVTQQSVVAPPAACTATYTTSIVGTPDSPVITGTTGNDFIYAVGGNYRISGGRGNDCLVVGDGANVISGGSGADVVIAGNGSNRITVTGRRNVVVVGDGDGNRLTVRGVKTKGKLRTTTGNVVTVGDGAANRVLVRKGSGNQVTVGDGARNRVTVKGSKNVVSAGDGTRNRLIVGKGTRNRISTGDGSRNSVTVRGTRNQVILGKGSKNRVVVRTSATPRTTCSLPRPPRTWRGAPARYYRDVLTRCRVVTR